MRAIHAFAATALSLAAATSMAQNSTASPTQPGESKGMVTTAQPVYTKSMEQLQQAAQRLRESIQALAQKTPGPERERAISKAHEALLETQQAMISLPPELRTSGTVSTTGYDESVKQLQKSADSLRQAIQAMAQQPAGERRNQAIEQANRALWDTHVAIANAYQPRTTQAMGAAPKSGAATAGGNSTAQASGSNSGTKGSNPAAGGLTTALVLVPVQMASDAKLANGCWVRFFDEKNFRGDALTLVGPVDMARMETQGDLWKDWDSAIVGPRATVRTFDNENFRDRTATLTANQSIPDLRDRKLGWFEEVKSARVSCAA